MLELNGRITRGNEVQKSWSGRNFLQEVRKQVVLSNKVCHYVIWWKEQKHDFKKP